MKNLSLFFLLALSLTAKSQEGSLYVFDADWKPTEIKNAKRLLHTWKVNDSCWQWDYYNFVGPLIKTEQSKDKDGKEMEGISRHYDTNGKLDSTGNYHRGKKNGEFWRRNDEAPKYEFKYIYNDDSLIEVIDLQKKKKDSTISYKDEKESEYPGGLRGWQRYLTKNLKYPERAVNGNIEGQVSVLFIVDNSGNVIDPYISRSIEYSLDEEAIRIIKGSGKWEPAFQNGRNVKSYKMQPLNFRLQ